MLSQQLLVNISEIRVLLCGGHNNLEDLMRLTGGTGDEQTDTYI